MTRVFYVECAGDVWRGIAQVCAERARWTPVLWTAAHEDAAPVRALFPQVEFFAGPDAALNLIHPPWPVASAPMEELKALEAHEAIALRMMDRMDGGGTFRPEERRALYRELLAVWRSALEYLKPDRVIFSIAPHVVFDYVLYALCLHRRIPVLMFERHGLPGWVFTLDAIDRPSPALEAALEKPTGRLPPAYAAWLQGLAAGAGAAVPANFTKKLALYGVNKAADTTSLSSALAFEAKRALITLARHGLAGTPNSYLRSSRRHHGRARWLETECLRVRGLFRKRRMAAELRQLASAPQPGEPYVLMALHYQPERSTVPIGGLFGDQRLAVNVLAASLPDGWKLYVKEHPWQLQPFGRGEMQRDEDFYRDLARHPNVRLLPSAADTATLIDAARAVATISGSVGWQAMCRGVPALVFGEAWYRTCAGVFRIRNEADARTAFAAIAAGERVRPEAIERFTAALARACVPGVLEPKLESAEQVDPRVAAEAMAEALIAHPHRP